MSTISSQAPFDVVVIGGGPAGSTCAHTLAAAGHSVLVLEKTRHPRFHVGESLVPYTTGLLEMMGLLDQVENGPFVVKRSVESQGADGDYFRTYFSSLAEGQRKFGFNVERAPFDALLSAHAARAGACVIEDAEVRRVVVDGDRVTGVRYEHGQRIVEVRAPFVVDASGRAGLVARRFKLRVMNHRLKKVAVYQYFQAVAKGVNSSDEGDLVISTHEDGWIWCIPVGPDTRSVGAVMPAEVLAGRDQRQVFAEHVARSSLVRGALEGAHPLFEPVKVESDFCYHCELLAGPGYFLTGDAACFVDPVFSGGVFLGMVGGMKAAEAIGEVLDGGDEGDAAQRYQDYMKTGYDHYFRLVYAFYEGCEGTVACLFKDLFPGHFKLVLQLLAGDFWGAEQNPVLRGLRSRRDWDTFTQPFRPIYECPVYPHAHYTG